MFKLKSFRVYLNERLTAAAEEIFGAVEKTMVEYHDENERLRRLLRIPPETTISRTDSLQFSLSVSEEEVPPEQQHCEQEWSPSLGQEDPEPTQIKEEQEEEELHQGLLDTKDSILTPPCVKSECYQEDPRWSLTLPQTQTVENKESDSKPEDVQPFDPVTHLKVLNDSPSVDLSITPRKKNRCPDSRKTFAVKADMKKHLTVAKSYTCPFCGKILKKKSYLSQHMKIHTGEKPFSCGYCEKNFLRKWDLIIHKRIHTREKPFSCGNCGKSFSRKGGLNVHMLIHTGEKPFSCGDCGKSFHLQTQLNSHKPTHRGEKPFSCNVCGNSFSRKSGLNVHMLIHTGGKPFSCGDCGESFHLKNELNNHKAIHIGEKPVSSGICGKKLTIS